MEKQLRDAVAINQGSLSVFVTRPLSLTLLVIAVIALVLPYAPAILRRLRGERGGERLVFGSGSED
jgi:putative tricarboxylic transport membrane protein